jgi:hypothetical protein
MPMKYISEETLDNLRTYVRGRQVEDTEIFGTSLSYTVDDAVADLVAQYYDKLRKIMNLEKELRNLAETLYTKN